MNDGILPAAAMAAPVEQRFPVEFRGTAKEYFGIWIVNILLTILTIGIYSAWAKVRRERYFHGSTSIDGHAFDYHARPLTILKGRLIVLACFVAYFIAAHVVPLIDLLLIPFFIFGFPYLVYRGIRFSARVTSYRNVRFDFVGTYGGAMKAFVLGAIVSIFSLGLAAPVASRWSSNYVINNLRYGDRPFEVSTRIRQFYAALVIPFLIAVAGFIVGAGLVTLLMIGNAELVAAGLESEDPADHLPLIGMFYAGFIVFFITMAIASMLYGAAIRNLVYNSTVLDGRHRFQSFVSGWRIVWISVSNTFVTLVTLGLMRPWAAIRMSRYLAGATAVRSTGDLGIYSDQLRAARGVTGAEYMDAEGIEVGFGF